MPAKTAAIADTAPSKVEYAEFVGDRTQVAANAQAETD